MICGIYLLRFIGTTKVYIGQSLDIDYRFIYHCSKLRNGSHTIKMNAAYSSFGLPTLEYLCVCTEEELDKYENEAIEIFDAVINGFNCKDTSGYRPNLQGELSPTAKCTNEEVRHAFHLLVDYPNLRMEEISKIVDISINTVKDISCGNSHYWLKSEFPDKYLLLQNMLGTRNNGESNATSVYSNEVIIEVFNMCLQYPELSLIEISKKVGVHYDTIKSIATGSNHKWLKSEFPDKYSLLMSYKGTRRSASHSAKARGLVYPLIRSPEGVEYQVDNIKAFAREHSLNDAHLGAVLRGKEKQHKKWVIVV